MASYSKVSRLIPSEQRTMTITEVIAGDEFDIEEILGRPAKRLKIVPDDSTDSITIRLNNKITMVKEYQPEGLKRPEVIEVVSRGAHYPATVLTGASEYLTGEGLAISYITVDAITFGNNGTNITIVVW